jgi:hypothetical protein
MHNSGEIAPPDREGVFAFAVIASAAKQSTLTFSLHHGLLRGACHRARIRATRGLAMTVLQSLAPWLLKN